MIFIICNPSQRQSVRNRISKKYKSYFIQDYDYNLSLEFMRRSCDRVMIYTPIRELCAESCRLIEEAMSLNRIFESKLFIYTDKYAKKHPYETLINTTIFNKSEK